MHFFALVKSYNNEFSLYKILLLHDSFPSVYKLLTFPYKNAYFCSKA